jgi:hypothetical protein
VGKSGGLHCDTLGAPVGAADAGRAARPPTTRNEMDATAPTAADTRALDRWRLLLPATSLLEPPTTTFESFANVRTVVRTFPTTPRKKDLCTTPPSPPPEAAIGNMGNVMLYLIIMQYISGYKVQIL